MKKKHVIMIIVLIAIVTFFYVFVLSNYKKVIKGELGIDVRNCKLLKEYNTKGSFGDGEYIAILDCSKSKTIKKQLKNWNKIPMDKKTINNIYGNENEGYSSIGTISKKYNIPPIKNGYYAFYDQSPLTSYDLGDLAQNYVCAIYDNKTKKFYYIEYDS